MAFPTTGVLDSFTRADQTPLGGDWSTTQVQGGASALKVVSNQLGATAAFDNSYLLTSYGPDCEIYADVPTVPTAGSYIALFVRMQEVGSSAWDGYAVVIIQGSPWTWSIRRYTNATATVLGVNISNPTVVVGDSVGLEVIGSTIRALHKPSAGSWTEVGSRTDSTYGNSGKLGVELGDTTQRLDSLGGGTIVASSFTQTMMLLGIGA